MNIYALLSFFTGLFAILEGNYVFYQNPRDKVNRYYFVVSLLLAYCSFCEFGMRQAVNIDEAWFWVKAQSLWPFLLSFLMHGIFIMTGKKEIYGNRMYLALIHLPALVIALVDFGTEYISTTPVHYYWGWTYGIPVYSAIYIIATIWGISISILPLYLCIYHYVRQKDQRKRQQFKYLTIGLSIPIISGVVLDTVLPFVDVRLPETVTTASAIGFLFIGYGINRYGLFMISAEKAAENLLATMSDFLILTSEFGIIAHVNPAIERMLGYREDEIIGKDIMVFFSTGDVSSPGQKDLTRELIREGSINDFEMSLLTKSDNRITASISGTIIRDNLGIPMGNLWIGRDITKRKIMEEELSRARNQLREMVKERTLELIRANEKLYEEINKHMQTERELRESQKMLRLVIDNIPQRIFWKDREGKFLGSNSHFAWDAGRESPEEIIGGTDYDMAWNRDEADHYRDMDRRVLTTGEPIYRMIERQHQADGREAWLETNKLPFYDEHGVIMGILGTYEDITERKLMEEALKRSEQNYRNLFENANDAIMIIDPETMVILETNSKAVEILGYAKSRLNGKKLHELVREEAMESQDFLRVFGKDLVMNSEVTFNRSDGKPVRFLVNTSFIIYENKTSILSINRDITERERLLEQLYRTQKMESIGRLAGSVAHDLSHILTGLVTYPDIILMDLRPGDPLRSKIEAIKSSGQRAAEIVDDLLNIARGRRRDPENLFLNEVILECLDSAEIGQLRRTYPEVIFDSFLAPSIGSILCTRIQLLKVLYNLITNAVEAMPEGGKLLISTLSMQLSRTVRGYEDIPPGNYVLLSVSDTGIGISEADLPNIFELHFSRKTLGRSGSGMGLTIVWNIVKDYGGYIDVKSVEESGTVFHIYFPISTDNAPESLFASDAEEYMGSGESIVVIDDDEAQRETTVNVLGMLNYVPNALRSGEEAIDYLQSHRADLVIIDVMLGAGIDGLQTFARLRQENPQLKSIFVSGYSNQALIRQAQNTGAGEFIQKPFTILELGMAIKRELRR